MKKDDTPDRLESHQHFAAGETIFQEGDAGDTLYIVSEGEVDIFVAGQPVETVWTGGIFGEFALIDDKPRSATAIARTESTLTAVNRQHFLALIQKTPLFALQVMRVMAERLRRANARLHA